MGGGFGSHLVFNVGNSSHLARQALVLGPSSWCLLLLVFFMT
jgi:hypothetical protein